SAAMIPRKTSVAVIAGFLQDVHDVTILDYIRLPLQPIDTLALRLFHRPDPAIVVVADHLGPHEALGEIGVDLARAGQGLRARLERPRPALVLTDREEHDLLHAVVDRTQRVAAGRCRHAQVLHERLAILLG